MRSFLREPLVHFLLLGFLLFGLFRWRGGSGRPDSSRIVVSSSQVDNLVAGFTRTWQRPPDADELKTLIDEYVKEEIAVREAVALGLDQEDVVIRRRLRQKLEFLVQDPIDQVPPSDSELQAWLDRHPEAYRPEPEVAFRQVLVSVARRGSRARPDAVRLLEHLRVLGADAAIEQLGDPTMLPRDQDLEPLRETAIIFGESFARDLITQPPGRWVGPLESPYGLHLVLIRERIAPAKPDLAEVWTQVERDLQTERQRAVLDSLYGRLLLQYRVVVEFPKAVADSSATRVGAGE